MIVAFDTTFLNALFNANSGVAAYRAAVRHLVTDIGKNNDIIIIPMPVWAELRIGLMLYTNMQTYDHAVKEIEMSPFFYIRPFDDKSADILVEATSITAKAGNKRVGVDAPWQRVKFDRQIVAIAKAHGATTLYTADKDQARFAEEEFGLKVRDLESLGET